MREDQREIRIQRPPPPGNPPPLPRPPDPQPVVPATPVEPPGDIPEERDNENDRGDSR